MAYLSPLGEGVSWAFFASHGLVVLGFQISFAVAFSGRAEDRAWAAAVFCLPVALAAGPLLGGILGPHSSILVLGACLPACWAWGHWSRDPGAPFVTGVIGGLLGAQLAWFHHTVYAGRITPVHDLILTGGVVCALSALALLAGRGPTFLARPRAPLSMGLALGGFTLAMIVGPIRARPPTYEPDAGLSLNHADRAPIVLIVLDTVGAAHLGAYGYERNTMPQLEAFAAQQGFITARSIANAPWTLASHASIFTGLYPPFHGAHFPGIDSEDDRYGVPLSEQSTTLAELLAGAGYWTVAIAANFGVVARAYGLDQGFQVFRSEPNAVPKMLQYTPWNLHSTYCSTIAALNAFPPFRDVDYFGGAPYRRAKEITDEAIGAIDRAGGTPFFLFVNYMDAHGPYWPPHSFRETFPMSDPPLCIRIPTQEDESDARTVSYLRGRYDSELSYLDQELDRLLRRLATHSRWHDMLVVITADHGEAFGEHGHIGHGLTLHREELETPLFIKPAREERGSVERHLGLMQSVDLFPTILEHAKISLPQQIDGRAWGEGREEVFAWLYARGPAHLKGNRPDDLSSIQQSGWKLIRASDGSFELFDLARDPAETINRAGEEIERETKLRSALQTVDRGAPVKAADHRTSPKPTRNDMEALRALGYVEFE